MTRNKAVPKGYDFHCHIDLYPDPAAMISSCETQEIMTLAVTTTPKAWPQNKIWAATSSYVHPAVGLHPELVGERYQEIDLLEQYIKESPFIGEVGLDGSPKYRNSWENQKDVFARALRTAEKLGGRVISIHSRRAAKEVVEVIETLTTPDRVTCILHWFSGSASIAKKAASFGCYFSVNSQMLRSKQGAAITRSIPEDSILTETDGPFSTKDDRKSIPSDVLQTTEQIARLRQISTREMNDILAVNAARALEFTGILK